MQTVCYLTLHASFALQVWPWRAFPTRMGESKPRSAQRSALGAPHARLHSHMLVPACAPSLQLKNDRGAVMGGRKGSKGLHAGPSGAGHRQTNVCKTRPVLISSDLVYATNIALVKRRGKTPRHLINVMRPRRVRRHAQVPLLDLARLVHTFCTHLHLLT